jgi:RND family efflux transporter MFP subunit
MARRFVAISIVFVAICGCQQESVEPAKREPLPVIVSQPIEETIVDSDEFPGEIRAVDRQEVRAQVSGTLKSVDFKDGQDVAAGKELFHIDDVPFLAALAQAKSAVTDWQVRLDEAKANLDRATMLLQKKAISREEYDSTKAKYDSAVANLASAQEGVKTAEQDVKYTVVRAPIAGRADRAYVTAGNAVTGSPGGGTLLTTIVATDDVYIYFNIDDPTLQRVTKLVQSGHLKQKSIAEIPVEAALSSDSGFPFHDGKIDYVANEFDPGTGTLSARAIFKNPKDSKTGGRLLQPGQFAWARLVYGDPRPGLKVLDRAVGTDQGGRFIYVVNKNGEVEYRPVKLGAVEGGLRVVESGLKAGDDVIVNGIQRVRPAQKVQTKSVEMRSMLPPAEEAAAKAP